MQMMLESNAPSWQRGGRRRPPSSVSGKPGKVPTVQVHETTSDLQDYRHVLVIATGHYLCLDFEI